jgi:hypothetical protein
MKRHCLLTALATALFVGACGGVTDPTTELSISLKAERTTGPPEEVFHFSVEATGIHLFGVIVRYGDGAVDSVAVPGASTLTARLQHAYAEAGTYMVRAVAEERSGRNAIDSLMVRVERP